jgi:hypothetical protein
LSVYRCAEQGDRCRKQRPRRYFFNHAATLLPLAHDCLWDFRPIWKAGSGTVWPKLYHYLESPAATALCAVSSVSLNHRHDAPQGRGYNIQETASGSDNLHTCILENESHVRVILFVGFSYTVCRIAPKSYRPVPKTR